MLGLMPYTFKAQCESLRETGLTLTQTERKSGKFCNCSGLC